MLDKIQKGHVCIDIVFIIQVCLTFFNDDSDVSFAAALICILLVLFEIYLNHKFEKQQKRRRIGTAGCMLLLLLLGVLLWYR